VELASVSHQLGVFRVSRNGLGVEANSLIKLTIDIGCVSLSFESGGRRYLGLSLLLPALILVVLLASHF